MKTSLLRGSEHFLKAGGSPNNNQLRSNHAKLSCHEYEIMSEPEPRRLLPWEECWGMLQELRERDSQLLATIAGLVIALPPELRKRLEVLMGRKIAILRTDLDYRLRCLEGKQ